MNIFSRFQIHILTKMSLFALRYLVILRIRNPRYSSTLLFRKTLHYPLYSSVIQYITPKQHYINTALTLHIPKRPNLQEYYLQIHLPIICSLYVVLVQCQCSLYHPIYLQSNYLPPKSAVLQKNSAAARES